MSSDSSWRPCARTSPNRLECAGTAPVKNMRVRFLVLSALDGNTQCAPVVVGGLVLRWKEEGEGEGEYGEGTRSSAMVRRVALFAARRAWRLAVEGEEEEVGGEEEEGEGGEQAAVA